MLRTSYFVESSARMGEYSKYLPPFPTAPLPVAISECLDGGEVRFDGGHKRSSIPHARLAALFDFKTLCPEVGIGLGVPRDVIRLVGDAESPSAVNAKDPAIDVTARLQAFAGQQVEGLGAVDGYIFMKNSPSCGLFRVKVYPREGAMPVPEGRGIYAAAITQALPDLPVEESGRLNDSVLLENFVTRTFVHAHWRRLLDDGLTARSLIAFHTAYKYLVMAHSVPAYQQLGRQLSDLSQDLEGIAGHYFSGLMRALAKPASRGGHANVLSHLQGYVKKEISDTARRELAEVIDSYRRGEVPLLAPLTLLKHHLGENDATYALNQLYLQPHPAAAGLRRDLV